MLLKGKEEGARMHNVKHSDIDVDRKSRERANIKHQVQQEITVIAKSD